VAPLDCSDAPCNAVRGRRILQAKVRPGVAGSRDVKRLQSSLEIMLVREAEWRIHNAGHVRPGSAATGPGYSPAHRPTRPARSDRPPDPWRLTQTRHT
jgi:hypothetical protein